MNLIEDIARRQPADRVALIRGDRRVTFGELFELARPVAAEIRRRAADTSRPCPRVGLQWPNGIDYIVLSMAILLADACLVPLAEELAEDERREIIQTTALDFVLRPAAGFGERADPTANPPVYQIDAVGAAAEPAFPEDAFQALAPAFIRFSSGTTGRSKGVALTHATLRDRITAANRGLGLDASDRVLWMLPMAHHFAVSIVLYLHVGATTVLESSTLREDVLATAETHRATVVYGSPFHFAMLAGDPGGFRWPSLRLAVATAAALPAATAAAFRARFDHSLVQGLGIIEVGLPVLNLAAAAEKPGAIGRPLPDYEIALVDESGTPAADGRPGELRVRGPGLLDAYLVPWDPEPLDDGWFATGDLVVRDADGDLTLVGRKKSVINVGGMKVFPEEIEAVLDAHPEVRLSRVSAREHPHTGQVPVAEIIARDPVAPPAARALQEHCRRHLSAYKVPLRFKTVESLPRTASGKLKRGA
jgi:long-chain acyl-CoA synthetase